VSQRCGWGGIDPGDGDRCGIEPSQGRRGRYAPDAAHGQRRDADRHGCSDNSTSKTEMTPAVHYRPRYVRGVR